MSKIVIALGGNALGDSPKEQIHLLENVCRIIVDLIKQGNKIVLTHGNGPQVGQIVLAMDYSASGKLGTPDMPFAECGSMSQGYIGYQLQQCLQDELERQNIHKNCATLITQVLVDADDPGFDNPTKPIGMFYSKEEADKIALEKGYSFIEDSGRGYRRVVPSPKPIDIIEKDVIRQLIDNDNVVICAGGGGIPVIKTDKIELLEGVAAVIDKDRSAALLARQIGADVLMILTSVDKVSIHYNTDGETPLDEMDVSLALEYIKSGEFAVGSMLPKVEACIDFVKDNDDAVAIIGSLDKANLLLDGKSGTRIRRR